MNAPMGHISFSATHFTDVPWRMVETYRHVLVLDEPTNFLDLESVEALVRHDAWWNP